jgi:hypothetical protein
MRLSTLPADGPLVRIGDLSIHDSARCLTLVPFVGHIALATWISTIRP